MNERKFDITIYRRLSWIFIDKIGCSRISIIPILSIENYCNKSRTIFQFGKYSYLKLLIANLLDPGYR